MSGEDADAKNNSIPAAGEHQDELALPADGASPGQDGQVQHVTAFNIEKGDVAESGGDDIAEADEKSSKYDNLLDDSTHNYLLREDTSFDLKLLAYLVIAAQAGCYAVLLAAVMGDARKHNVPVEVANGYCNADDEHVKELLFDGTLGLFNGNLSNGILSNGTLFNGTLVDGTLFSRYHTAMAVSNLSCEVHYVFSDPWTLPAIFAGLLIVMCFVAPDVFTGLRLFKHNKFLSILLLGEGAVASLVATILIFETAEQGAVDVMAAGVGVIFVHDLDEKIKGAVDQIAKRW
eukprot:CAMPEP_0202689174 /NCGR_PEP_ID=MMETSP1385-20130828/4501_1 /ASSEMBLY_ACC=CAM_ASM_000861 /TAXON_ID=933848 /ORGANISM="Elphidium margaritaceum" /LENGTH=289 /DNA_ID=CAMNT_0049344273 /DNA_START=47 /DNA_END=913 /DNA_ORIENTATION=-